MFEYEEVKETVGKAFAKEANAAFKLVSAKSANGIDVVLFLDRNCFIQQGKCYWTLHL